MSDFLLELRSEEIPARMQKGARAELEKLFRREMDAAGVSIGELTIWSTPRRLALIARDLPTETEAVSEEAKGPPEAAPDQAVDGFCRKLGLTRDQLEVRDLKGRPTYFAVINTPGRAVAEVLAEAIPAIIRDFSWPKSQRWGAASISTESLRWVRPLSGIVALLGTDIIECEVHGIKSGRATKGHRFHHSGDVIIGGAANYVETLHAAHVIVDHAIREDYIAQEASKLADVCDLTLVEDQGLVVENAGLTEWPVPMLGRFEDDFLEVPPETIQLTARVNQKYFVCEKDGKLANAFICTSNIDADDPAVVVEGNRKVLAARLSDAKFFWDVDRKKTLAEHAKGLERITFHEKLGTVADKVERVAKLARWLCQPYGPANAIVGCDPDLAEQAARLCKADLVTEMVGEFPELQGLMGGYYASAEGLDEAVANAIRDHYKPVGHSDDAPTANVTVALSLADKLDTLMCFFAIDEKPTGSKDPFALRRAALGVIRIILDNSLRFSLDDTLEIMAGDVMMGGPNWDRLSSVQTELAGSLMAHICTNEAGLVGFLVERFKVQQRAEGIRHDLIDALFGHEGEDDLVRLLARVKALQAFMNTEDGTNLLAGYKRASNILKKEGWDNSDAPQDNNNSLSYSPEASEKVLIDALDAAGPKAAAAIESEDFEGAMAALATLRTPIDEFFDHVTVNDSDETKRAARLDLLAQFRGAVHQVADFSKIEG